MKTKPIKKKVKRSPEQGPCWKKNCNQNGCTIYWCRTCEALHGEQADAVFRVQTCIAHASDGLKKIRRHALIAHPANLLRVIAAGLKGEQL